MENDKDTELITDEESDASELQARLKKLKEALKTCEAERKEYLDGWQRAKADHINYRNEEGARFEDMARFVLEGVVRDILPVLDSFDLAVGHGLGKETERGVLLIRSQLEDALKKRGIGEIAVNAGDVFDPSKHESIGETEAGYPSGSIAQVVQKGYTLGGKVLRPARVRLAK